jgi:pimeloyl-ACP methyl ester carboxylesterase
MMPEDRYIKVRNLRTRYWRLGDHGTAVILLHGLGASADIWKYNLEALAKQHRVYAPDLMGFGRSEKPGPSFSPFDFALFLHDFIDLLNIETPSLVGQSFGGGIALHYGLQYPQNLRKLVLVGSAGLGKEVTWTLRLMSLPLIGEFLSYPSRKGVEIFFKIAVRNQALVTKDFVDLYYEFFSKPGFQKFLLQVIRSLINIHGARDEVLPDMDDLKKISQPALIVWGENDRVLPLKQAYRGKENLPNARVKIMKGCGHLPFFERSEEFNRLVLEFLSE